MKYKVGLIGILLLVLCISSCATMSTVEGANPKIPKFYSGTRLNICALRKLNTCATHFSANPPKHPTLDLPGSLLFDSLIAPITMWKSISHLY